MRTALLWLLFVVSSAATPAYGAIILDFEALAHVDSSTASHGHTYIEDGFQLSKPSNPNFQFITYGTLHSRFSGSTALINDLGSSSTTLTRVGGGAFDLDSINLAEYVTDTQTPIVFTAQLFGGGTATHSVTMDGVAYGQQTFLFPSTFNNVVSVSWTNNYPYHQLDNITIADSGVVPEPASLILWSLGTLGVALGSRIRRLRGS